MKTNSRSVVLPIVANAASGPVDLGAGFNGFVLQLVGVTLDAGATYTIDGSVDGVTWVDITHNFKDLGNGGAAVAAPIGGDSLYEYPARFPGFVQIVCKTAPTSPPAAAPTAWFGYQDTSQA